MCRKVLVFAVSVLLMTVSDIVIAANSSIVIEDWNFNNGTKLSESPNSVSGGAVWSTGLDGTVSHIDNGRLIRDTPQNILRGADADISDKTSGIVFFVAENVNLTGLNEKTDGFVLKIRQNYTHTVCAVTVAYNGANIEISGTGSGSNLGVVKSITGSTIADLNVGVELDMDNDTYRILWKIGESSWCSSGKGVVLESQTANLLTFGLKGYTGESEAMTFDRLYVSYKSSDSTDAGKTMAKVTKKMEKSKKIISYADPDKWFAFPIPYKGYDFDKSLINFSFLLDAPAGKYGFVHGTTDGKFVFDSGESIRFFALSIHAANAIDIPHNEAEYFAKRLASLGCNLLRIHSYDRPAPSGILDPDAHDTFTLDPVQMEKFDYLIYALKKQGIYIAIDLFGNHRRLKINDGIIGIEDYASEKGGNWQGPYGRCYVDPDIEELYKRFGKACLEHYNPYTKLRWVDEPAIALMGMSGEFNIARMADAYGGIHNSTYRSLLRTAWNRWLLEKYGSRDALAKAWTNYSGECPLGKDEDPARNTVEPGWMSQVKSWSRPNQGTKSIGRMADFAKFISQTVEQYGLRMRKFFRSLGVKCAINDTDDLAAQKATLLANIKQDYSDRHGYWDHPPYIHNIPLIKVNPVLFPVSWGHTLFPRYALASLAQHPMVIGEWTTCWPNEWRSSDMLMMSAYASLNDWDASIAFSYIGGWGLSSVTMPKDKIPYPTFLCFDPAEMGVFPLAALAFCQNYIATSINTFEYGISSVDTYVIDKHFTGKADIKWGIDECLPDKKGFFPDNGGGFKAFRGSKYAVIPKVDELTPDQAASFATKTLQDWKILKPGRGYLSRQKKLRSDTGELTLDYGKGRFTVDTPKIVGFSGFKAKDGMIQFKDAVLKLESKFCTFILISMDGKNLNVSEKILLMIQGRCDNSGRKLDMTASPKLKSLFDGKTVCDTVDMWNSSELSEIIESGKNKKSLPNMNFPDKGNAPIVVEPVSAVLRFNRRELAPDLEAVLLDRFGIPKEDIPINKTASGYTVSITPKWKTIYCIIRSKRSNTL